MTKDKNADFTYNVIEEIAVLSENPATHWQKCLQRISWNDGSPKYDIREWNPEHTRMSKGITLTDFEMDVIRGLILHGRL